MMVEVHLEIPFKLQLAKATKFIVNDDDKRIPWSTELRRHATFVAYTVAGQVLTDMGQIPLREGWTSIKIHDENEDFSFTDQCIRNDEDAHADVHLGSLQDLLCETCEVISDRGVVFLYVPTDWIRFVRSYEGGA